jgi:hypothetical protein
MPMLPCAASYPALASRLQEVSTGTMPPDPPQRTGGSISDPESFAVLMVLRGARRALSRCALRPCEFGIRTDCRRL